MRGRHNAEVGMTEVVPTSAQPGLHAHLRDGQERTVLDQADHGLETDAGEAETGQRPAHAAHASARSGARPLAGQRGARAHGVLRRARQHPGSSGLPRPANPALAADAAAPQPENPDQLGTDEPDRNPVATTRPHDAPLPRSALRRHTPKVGAQCGNPARWDLRGGPPVRAVPTATQDSSQRAGHDRTGKDGTVSSAEVSSSVSRQAATGRVDAARLAHNPEIAGSNPAPATKPKGPFSNRERASACGL